MTTTTCRLSEPLQFAHLCAQYGSPFANPSLSVPEACEVRKGDSRRYAPDRARRDTWLMAMHSPASPSRAARPSPPASWSGVSSRRPLSLWGRRWRPPRTDARVRLSPSPSLRSSTRRSRSRPGGISSIFWPTAHLPAGSRSCRPRRCCADAIALSLAAACARHCASETRPCRDRLAIYALIGPSVSSSPGRRGARWSRRGAGRARIMITTITTITATITATTIRTARSRRS